MNERIRNYSNAVQNKTEQMGLVALILRTIEKEALLKDKWQFAVLTKIMRGRKNKLSMTFNRDKLGGLYKIFYALMDDLIDMEAPEAATAPLRFYKYGDPNFMTKREEDIARKLIDGKPGNVSPVDNSE